MSDQPEEETTHCRLAPSAMHRVLNCPGSARNDLPDTSNAASNEGTLAHDYGAALLLNIDFPPDVSDQLSQLAERAFDEMTSGVGLYIDYVRGVPGTLYVEQKIVSAIVPEFGGTTDAVIDHPALLHVVDLKYGMMYVPAKDNPQILAYLCLAREKFGRREKYRGTIVQPRVLDGRIDTWDYTNDDLDAHLMAIIEASQDDSIRAGEWCKYCPLLVDCRVAFEHAKGMAEAEFSEVVDEIPGESDIPRLVEIDKFEDVVKRMAEGARARMLAFIQRGGKIAGYKAAMSLGHRAWINPDMVPTVLHREGIGTEVCYHPPELKSPAQLEKTVPASLLKDLWHRPERGITVVHESSKMQEVTFDEFDAIPTK